MTLIKLSNSKGGNIVKRTNHPSNLPDKREN